MQPSLYNLLYCSPQGEELALEDMQLIDPVPSERIEPLSAFLEKSDNDYESFQIVLLLLSWGESKVIPHAILLIKRFGDDVLDPHRHNGGDVAFDRLAQAGYYYTLNNPDRQKIVPLFQCLISYYPEKLFEGRIQHALEQLAMPVFFDDVMNAFQRCIDRQKYFDASWLLPYLAKIDPGEAWKLIQKLLPFDNDQYSPYEHIGHALRYIKTPEAKKLLVQFSRHTNSLVRHQVKQSLNMF